MLRRTFIAGLLTAPALVRASSLDFVPRGVPLSDVINNVEWIPLGADTLTINFHSSGLLTLG